MTDKHLTNIRFTDFDLSPELLQGIESAGFSRCTPIQAETLPIALAGKDVSGQAQTGTGKTAAFLIATYNHLLKNPPPPDRHLTSPRAIILAPTRELAVQIHKDAEAIGKFTGLKLGLVYGGTGYESQRLQLEAGVDILIGTPGRLIDYFKQRIFSLMAVQVMVLDEADRMFDLGFIKDIRYLFRRMPQPAQRLNLLFSATLSHRVQELAYEHMNNPQPVEIEPDQITADQVEELVFYPSKEEKIPLLLGILKSHPVERVLIFVNTKRVSERVAGYLEGNGYRLALLTGDVPQKKRLSLLEAFTSGDLNIMVATDVAARGLHIPAVSHVINFDLPQDVEDYVHRIGRTARAGAKGDAISFACDEFVFSLPEIEEYIGHKIPVGQIGADLLVESKPPVFKPRKPRPPGSGRGRNSGDRSRRPRTSRPRRA
ncbi:MAG: ATP-dependent RNA helicase RhlB [Candidatus Promineifilaceae bacterium]|jgi:ATP-dependent RNA helicase RhlB|nr:ATP-dependent RNA helicase RhlB [Pseudomonadota bacterium]